MKQSHNAIAGEFTFFSLILNENFWNLKLQILQKYIIFVSDLK